MQRSSTSTSTILFVILLLLTFPIWIGIAGGLFGMIIGFFGAVVGIIAGIFGAIIGIIGGIFGWIFDWHWPFHFWGAKTIVIAAIILAVVLVATRSRKT